jgi:hypothetical protein
MISDAGLKPLVACLRICDQQTRNTWYVPYHLDIRLYRSTRLKRPCCCHRFFLLIAPFLVASLSCRQSLLSLLSLPTHFHPPPPASIQAPWSAVDENGMERNGKDSCECWWESYGVLVMVWCLRYLVLPWWLFIVH